LGGVEAVYELQSMRRAPEAVQELCYIGGGARSAMCLAHTCYDS
jgi:hypothetical protein